MLDIKIIVAWLILCLTTLAAAVLSGTGDPQYVGISVLSIAFFKVCLVMYYFMELNVSPRVWLWLFFGWAMLTALGLIGLTVLSH